MNVFDFNAVWTNAENQCLKSAIRNPQSAIASYSARTNGCI